MTRRRLQLLSIAVFMVVAAALPSSALAYTDVELDMKTRLETRIHEQTSRYLLQKGLEAEQFRIVENVEVYTATPNTQKPSTELSAAAKGTENSLPSDLTVGFIEARKIYETVEAKRKELEKNPGTKNTIEIDRIWISLSIRADVDATRPEELKKGLTSFIEAGFQVKPTVELGSIPFSKPATPPEPTALERLGKAIAPIAQPLSSLFLVLGMLMAGVLFLMIYKKVPSWYDINSHKIQLQNLEKSLGGAGKDSKELSGEKKVDIDANINKTESDPAADFKRVRELQLRLVEFIASHLDKEQLEAMLLNWSNEEPSGLKKCVLAVRTWNDVKPKESVELDASTEVVKAFRDIATLDYGQRANLLEAMLFELSGAIALGSEAFGHRLGFLLKKPIAILTSLFSALEDVSLQARFAGMLPQEKRSEVLAGIAPETKLAILTAVMEIDKVDEADLKHLVDILRTKLADIEKAQESNGGDELDYGPVKLEMIAGLTVRDELTFVLKVREQRPRIVDWLKENLFCMSLLPELKPQILGELTSKLPPQEITQFALALPEPFTEKLLASLPTMKATIVKDSIGKAKAAKREPDWNFLDQWTKLTRARLREDDRFKSPEALYEKPPFKVIQGSGAGDERAAA